MRRYLTCTVIGDGGTDRVLVPIIRWAINRLDPEVDLVEPDFRKRIGSLTEFFSAYRDDAMLTFAHRDAEGESYEQRMQEFDAVAQKSIVPVIPVCMSEAWLLIDAKAIALASGRPDVLVTVPPVATLESIRDPKSCLEQLLYEAAGSPTGRRRRVFRRDLVDTRVAVAGYISDYSPLENLSAFRNFQDALAERYPFPPQGA